MQNNPPSAGIPRSRVSSNEFSTQWTHPADVFSVLLLLGGDVVARALAQLVGGWITPVAFSFGWVSYAVTAVVGAIGENKVMPQADSSCKVINGQSGYVRDNKSWVIGRLVRDYEYWMDPRVAAHLAQMLEDKWTENRAKHGRTAPKPQQAGLCVSLYRAETGAGRPRRDLVYYTGFATMALQLGIAAIPFGLFGDWGILMITACGTVLSFLTGGLPQWAKEKWACRRILHRDRKTVVLTRGNGSQHAIVVFSEEGRLDLEDLAVGTSSDDVSTLLNTRVALIVLAFLWIMLLITAAGIEKDTWFLLAVGGVGILQNVVVAGVRRTPAAFGIPLSFDGVIGKTRVMETLFAVEERYKGLGKSMIDTYFPGGYLREAEKVRWEALDNRI